MSSYSAQPVRADLNVAAMSVGTDETDVFLADDMFPIFSSAHASAVFERYGVEVDTQLPAGSGERATGADFDETKYAKTQDSYKTREYGLKGVIDNATELNADRHFREEVKTVTRLRRIVRTLRDRRAANLTINNSVYANGTSMGTNVGAVWSGAGTPIGDIIDACNAVRAACAYWPNTLRMSHEAFFELSMNTETAARLNTTVDNGAFVELPRLSALLNIPKILIDNVPYNLSPDGVAPAIGRVWDKTKVFLSYTRTDDTLEDVQFGRTVAYDEGLGGGVGQSVSWGDHPRMQEYAHFMNVEEKILVAECGYALHNVLS